jgi:hypothetical protein
VTLAAWPSPGGLFAPLSPLIEGLPFAPELASLELLSARCDLRSAGGRRLSFVAPQGDGVDYETRIWARGEVETRPGNWHDFFNALVWLSFPLSKSALNASHVEAMAAPGARCGRGRDRDALTHFDECGVVVVSSDCSLLALLRGFQWKTLFWERRLDLGRALRCFVFGHATYEQLLQPFRGLTAKAVLHEVGEDWLRAPLCEQLADVDRRLASEVAAGRHRDPRAFHPFPLLGLPGVTEANESPSYYDDAWQFRAGRTRRRV